MKSKLEIKFPCGYEYRFLYSEYGRTLPNLPAMIPCPLHGKKCSQFKSKANKK